MKNRFNTFDLICSLSELQKYVGLRVNQVYDIDNKTYLIRLQKTEEKVILLLESGNRIHTTGFEWPKNPSPSGFSMKLRKHLKNKRLESIKQVGIDRIVDLQFGSGEAAHHVFLELFDRGNIMLTDHELTILYVLRPHTQGDRYIFAVREKYPIERARCKGNVLNKEELLNILNTAKDEDTLRKVLTLHLEYGPALIEHALLGIGLQGSSKIGKDNDRVKYLDKLWDALNEAENILQNAYLGVSKGYIIQKIEKRPTASGGEDNLKVNLEFHPLLYRQHASSLYEVHESFDKAVDIFFSSLEGQKIDMKVVQQERDAVKKLENVRKDHHQRLDQLEQSKEVDKVKAELITKNLELVEKAIIGVRAMVANQIAWNEIQAMVKLAGTQGDEAAAAIKSLKLDINHIVLQLKDPYQDNSDEESQVRENVSNRPTFVEIDLDLSAYANARKYYDKKRTATKKQEKTLESQGKALKSAEKKTKKALQEMKTIVNITKARKVFWFEKFFWFISSENYLVIAGRDAGQNELVVKRYMRGGDIYVHADIHGASSIVIKNKSGEPVPVKTLNEAGIMAICYSCAWDAKVITNAWWVKSEQVLKSAPSGEYLPTGSFTIKGKKNFLPPTNLILGFSFLFKLEEDSVFRHADERKVRSLEDDVSSVSEMGTDEVEVILSEEEDEPPNESAFNDDGKKEEENEYINEGSSSEDETEDVDNTNTNEEEEVVTFPDTEIKILHSGKEISLETKTSNVIEQCNDDETVVYLGDEKPVLLKLLTNNKKPPGEGKKSVKFQTPAKTETAPEVNKLKRGQRSKLKKIKEKYADQDEEDKLIRMEFLQAAGNKKNSKKEKKKQIAQQMMAPKAKSKFVPPKKLAEKGSGDESDEDPKEPVLNDDVSVISTLTGIPHSDDELIFAVPVVAPYTTLQNYKYKVKLTPGTGKRGKAARTALAIFLKDKTTTQRERDILKGVKDEELARNIPGKVKVSAPQLHKK